MKITIKTFKSHRTNTATGGKKYLKPKLKTNLKSDKEPFFAKLIEISRRRINHPKKINEKIDEHLRGLN